MTTSKELLEMDLYGLLGVESVATLKQIKKAYRQRALSCHPDKNPDNPQAAELFHKLSQALEVLTDAAARAAYDKICDAKKQAEERNRKLDNKRKKFKLDLEAREKAASEKEDEAKNSCTLEEKIARLREEGQRELEEYQRREREKHTASSSSSSSSSGLKNNSDVTPKLKLKWKCKKDDPSNGGYSQESLERIFQKYGDVLNILISRKKSGSAVVEFSSVRAADMAFKYESGLTVNPLKISWLEGQPVTSSHNNMTSSSQDSLVTERDYESVVLMKLRQAEERKKLIEEMKKKDEETN